VALADRRVEGVALEPVLPELTPLPDRIRHQAGRLVGELDAGRLAEAEATRPLDQPLDPESVPLAAWVAAAELVEERVAGVGQRGRAVLRSVHAPAGEL